MTWTKSKFLQIGFDVGFFEEDLIWIFPVFQNFGHWLMTDIESECGEPDPPRKMTETVQLRRRMPATLVTGRNRTYLEHSY